MLPTISIGVARWPTSSAITPAWSSDPVTNKTTPAMERKVASAMEHQGGFTRVSNSSSSESSWSVRTLTVSLNLPSGARPPPVVIGLRLRFILCADKCSAERVKCLAPPTFSFVLRLRRQLHFIMLSTEKARDLLRDVQFPGKKLAGNLA